MEKKNREAEKDQPSLFTRRPKAPPLVRILAAIALIALLTGMYLYASRLSSAAGSPVPGEGVAASPVAELSGQPEAHGWA